MKNILLFLSFLGLLTSATYACLDGLGKDDVIKNPFLYSAKKNGKEIYFLGTFHGDISLDQFPSLVGNLIKTSDIVVLEADKINEHKAASFLKTMAQGFFTKEPSLKKSMPPRIWKQLVKVLKKQKFNEETISRLTFGGAFFFYMSSLRPAEADRNELSLDSFIQKAAEERGVKTDFLDDPYHLADAFNTISAEDLIQAVLSSMPDKRSRRRNKKKRKDDKLLSEYRVLKEAYMEGNGDKILEISNDTSSGMKELQDQRLGKSRNLFWLKNILEFHRSPDHQHIFVAVGAMHLIGHENILDLLKAEGFKVQRVKFN